MPKLRVGIVNYLNSRPLAWGFLNGGFSDLAEPVYCPPAQVANLLQLGDLDVGLIPSIEYQRIPNLSLVPGLCVAATTEVRSVLLVCDRPIQEVKKVALDFNSRTSAALVRIILRENFGLNPEYCEKKPDLSLMLENAEAALIIGDPALDVDRGRFQVYDLAAEWRQLTQRPFVFAVWAVRSEVELSTRMQSMFSDSLRLGLQEIESIIDAATAELGLSRPTVADYLNNNLGFALTNAECDGLHEFFQRACDFGLIEKVRPLRFLE